MYTDGSVTKDQPGCEFTVKQGATTIHEDSAAYTVLTSSLTIEMEAVAHALRWIASRGDSRTTHPHRCNELARKSEKWNESMFDISLRKLMWMYCPGHAGVKGNDRANRLVGKATITRGLRLGRREMLRNL